VSTVALALLGALVIVAAIVMGVAVHPLFLLLLLLLFVLLLVR
jgi:hypothetical protein